MMVTVSISNNRQRTFEKMLSGFMSLACQVDIVSRKEKMKTVYYIPYETEKQRRTLKTIEKTLR